MFLESVLDVVSCHLLLLRFLELKTLNEFFSISRRRHQIEFHLLERLRQVVLHRLELKPLLFVLNNLSLFLLSDSLFLLNSIRTTISWERGSLLRVL